MRRIVRIAWTSGLAAALLCASAALAQGEAKKKDEQGFFSKILGQEKPVPAPQYRVQVSATGQAGTQVQVFAKDGKPERSAAGDGILALLNDQLR